MNKFIGQRITIGIFFFAFVFFLHTGIILAAQEPQLELKTTVEKEVKVKKDGKLVVEKIPVQKSGPGDILLFTITYRNMGKGPAVDAQIVDPIPVGVAIITESIEGKDAEVTCSVDNAKSWHKPPIMMQIKKPDGTQSLKPAPAEKYTHVKWVIKKPVMSGQVSFKVIVK